MPVSVQHLGPGAIQPNHVIPPRRDWQAVDCLRITIAELDLDGTVSVLLRGAVVERVGAVLVRLVVAFGVVDTHGPEAVDGHVTGTKRVDGFSVVPGWREVEIGCILVRIASPRSRRANQTSHRIDLLLRAKRAFEVWNCRP